MRVLASAVLAVLVCACIPAGPNGHVAGKAIVAFPNCVASSTRSCEPAVAAWREIDFTGLVNGVRFTARTDGYGVYSLSLPAGAYRIHAEYKPNRYVGPGTVSVIGGKTTTANIEFDVT
jgi:hypothetical protein